jgi:hypothetical protein
LPVETPAEIAAINALWSLDALQAGDAILRVVLPAELD